MLTEKEKFIFIIILQISSLFFIIGFKELGWINDAAKKNVYEYKKSAPVTTEVINKDTTIDSEIADITYTTPNLVGWWKFDEDQNSLIASDSSGNGLQGVINSSGYRWLSDDKCIDKGCLDLHGTTAIDFTIPALPQYSFSGWVKKTDNIFEESQIFSSNGDNAGVTIYDDQRILFFDHRILKSSSITEPGIFYHLVVTNDGENKKIYINGELEGTGETASNREELARCLELYDSSYCADSELYEGITSGWARFGSLGMNGRNLHAVIDDFRIYDGPLSAQDVKNIYKDSGQ